MPASDASQMYYSMKLCAFNLTVYEAAPPNKAYCFAWTEVNAQRGSSEIGTALFEWFKTISKDVTEVNLYSDTCSGQNRNQYVAALFLYMVQNTHLERIQHNFLEKGHSYMEVDSMHSAIGNAKKNIAIYTMNDLLNAFRMAHLTELEIKRANLTHAKNCDFQTSQISKTWQDCFSKID